MASRITGKERDAESGLDYFGARYYGSTMGRWLSPDWSAKPAAVPYAELENPQSLNLYSYVLNNPLDRTDPDGHADCGGKDGPPCKATATAQDQSTSRCQSQSCNVKVVSDTTTPSPFVPGVVNRDVSYQAVDSSGKPVRNTEVSLHETSLPGKEGGDAKNYGYCGGKGCSNSDPAPKAEGDLGAGRFNDRMSQGTNGPAAFKQTYTVEGKPANIIWPTRNGSVTAISQTVKISAEKVVIVPEVKQ